MALEKPWWCGEGRGVGASVAVEHDTRPRLSKVWFVYCMEPGFQFPQFIQMTQKTSHGLATFTKKP